MGWVMFLKTQFGHHYGYIWLATRIEGSRQNCRHNDESRIWEMKLQHEKTRMLIKEEGVCILGIQYTFDLFIKKP